MLSLAANGVVGIACTDAKVSADTAYRRRRGDPEFAQRWRVALNQAADILELEARRRAAEGVNEPVIHQGELCGTWVDEDGQQCNKQTEGAKFIPLTVKKYSDTLLIFLLKGARPKKYRDQMRLEHSGKIKHTHSVKPAIQRLRDNPAAFQQAKQLADRMRITSDN
jgi:hypothetical protein